MGDGAVVMRTYVWIALTVVLLGSYCGAGGTSIAALGPLLRRMNPCDVT
jgi:hypothetical protein